MINDFPLVRKRNCLRIVIFVKGAIEIFGIENLTGSRYSSKVEQAADFPNA
jgi:hypothetical protein